MFKHLLQSVLFLFSCALFLFNVQIAEVQVTQEWVERYHGSVNGNDHAEAIAVDDLVNVHVTGAYIGSGTYRNYTTIKFKSSSSKLNSRQ